MVSDSFQYGSYQVVHTLLVIYHRFSCNAVCNNHATGHGFMSKQFGQAGYGTAFHFKIRDMQSLIDIGFDFFYFAEGRPMVCAIVGLEDRKIHRMIQ